MWVSPQGTEGCSVDEVGPAGQAPFTMRGEGLTLRPWSLDDVPFMISMFNTSEMDRWTPLAHPFDEAVAIAYVERANSASSGRSVQLAITDDGRRPLGEVLLFPTEVPETCEFAYAVGVEHRGRHLASRALLALLPHAREGGFGSARLRIAIDNVASQKVATAAGFSLTDEPLLRRERKGYVLDMATWWRAID